MTRLASAYTCIWIPTYAESQRVGERRYIWVTVLAHLVCVSVPWIHPRMRRRVHRRGRR